MTQDRTEQPLAEIADSLRQVFPKLFAVYRFGSFGTEYHPSSPLEAVSDPLHSPPRRTGCCFCSTLRETRKGSVRRSVHSMEAVGANALGTIMNIKKGKDYYYYGDRH